MLRTMQKERKKQNYNISRFGCEAGNSHKSNEHRKGREFTPHPRYMDILAQNGHFGVDVKRRQS